jgi:anti-sigma factor RsiW
MSDESVAGGPGQVGGIGSAECGTIRDLLPLGLAGSLPRPEKERVEAHLVRCDACREEERFLGLIFDARPRAPGSLASSVIAALDRETPGRVRRGSWTWGLPAAAAVVLALGVGLVWQGTETRDPMWSLALDAPAESWGQEDWMVAGSALLDGVSDETLLALLEEMYP